MSDLEYRTKINGKFTPTYRSFLSMKDRCLRPKAINYKYYGGRGIRIHPAWLGLGGFKNFVNDLGNRPDGTTLDRLDHEGNYEPGNVRWANKYEQAANKRTATKTVGVTFDKFLGRWRARMVVDGIDVFMGETFDSQEQASHARKLAYQKYTR